MKHIGLIVAAGSGTRVGGDIPKQFMEVGGKPLLFYSLKTMQDSFLDEIIVVTGEDWIDHVRTEIVAKEGLTKVIHVVKGGSERGSSVYEGLRAIEDPADSYVYIHDGARPLLTEDTLERLKEGVEKNGAVLAAVPCKDTIKVVDTDGTVKVTPERSALWLAQTPQVFMTSEIKAAYEEAYTEAALSGGFVMTDDASVMEIFGNRPVKAIMGDYSNIKVTTPGDFETVRLMLGKQ